MDFWPQNLCLRWFRFHVHSHLHFDSSVDQSVYVYCYSMETMIVNYSRTALIWHLHIGSLMRSPFCWCAESPQLILCQRREGSPRDPPLSCRMNCCNHWSIRHSRSPSYSHRLSRPPYTQIYCASSSSLYIMTLVLIGTGTFLSATSSTGTSWDSTGPYLILLRAP